MTNENVNSSEPKKLLIDRRTVLLGGAAATAAVGMTGALNLETASGAGAATKVLKVGYVSPLTGPLAGFGGADSYVIKSLASVLKKGVIIGGQHYEIQVYLKDSQSVDSVASTVAAQLIQHDKVHIMLVGGSPDNCNPVSSVCEANAVPCIATNSPYESWYFRDSPHKTGNYKWTYLFFWGLPQLAAVYKDIWSKVSTNKQIGSMFPNDADGDAYQAFFTPAYYKSLGYTADVQYGYTDGVAPGGFAAQVSSFLKANDDIFMAVPIPPDFTTFWNEAMSAGYHPKVATVAKAMLFPSNANALGNLCVNVCSEVWWSPTHPYKSSITKQSCQQLANAYQKTTGNQWVATLGMNHALFEVLFATLKKANSVHSAAIVKALSTLHINTIAGPVNWNSNPQIGGKALKNITVTPLVGGQWRKSAPGSKFPYEQIVVTNTGFPHIPRGGNVQAIKYA